jgi:ribosomal protein S18 acetylase RimI-like enzyme
VEDILSNPVYYALKSGDAHMGTGTQHVKYFNDHVSPFVGFDIDPYEGFRELYYFFPAGRKILYATRNTIDEPEGWQLSSEIKGLQFVFTGNQMLADNSLQLVALQKNHVDKMIELARLTKPGPFDKRTIEFGYYYGIFENDRLVAMTGQRLHVYNYTEISAVCTHPNHLGKGYASVLIQQQLNIIRNNDQIPFLHVRDDNQRAIALYERMGFTKNGAMNFYFMTRKN